MAAEKWQQTILGRQLGSLSGFAGTLLHEIAHAKTGYNDVSRELI
jgi:hypothetical protein